MLVLPLRQMSPCSAAGALSRVAVLALGLGTAAPLAAQQAPARTITLDDCDDVLAPPKAELGKCRLSPEDLAADLPPDAPTPAGPQPPPVAAVDAKVADAPAADAPGQAAALPAAPLGGGGNGGEVGDDAKVLPRISLVGLGAFAWRSAGARPGLGGPNPDRDGFTLQQVELGLEADVDAALRAAAFIHMSEAGVEVEEAYAATRGLWGNLEVKAGKYATSFGRMNEQHAHAWAFVNQPTVVARFLGSRPWSPAGAQLSWVAPLPFHLKASANAHNSRDVGGAGLTSEPQQVVEAGQTFGVGGVHDLLWVGRLEARVPFSGQWSLQAGGSGAFGPSGQAASLKTEIYGADLLLRFAPTAGGSGFALSWQSEGMVRRRQFPASLWVDWGVYSDVVVHVVAQVSAALRASVVDGDALPGATPRAAGVSRRERKGSVALGFAPSELSLLRLQYDATDAPWLSSRLVHGVTLQLCYSIGAHGARTF
ncbi:MAG: hypothetical protein HY903_24025 [Deltaproteobacteria bacterium]|nr:hypothetical protein [Deltaproteobacteria bacterium]